MARLQKITTSLWFQTQAEEAANLYVSLFPDSKIVQVHRVQADGGPLPKGTVMFCSFQLGGQVFSALNGGPFKFNESISLSVSCEDQAEVDRLWSALTANGGQESQCGWLKDPFGVSWQIVPEALPRLLGDPDPARAQRAMQAMLQMKKLDIAALEKAAKG